MMKLSPKTLSWIGRSLSLIICLPFFMSAAMKLMQNSEALKGMEHLGIPEHLLIPLGILELLCVAIYLIPSTSVLGAILLTGYMGGAILTHLRVGESFVMQALFGVIFWAGIYLREPRLRQILPWRCGTCKTSPTP